jgi:hypothetical protein
MTSRRPPPDAAEPGDSDQVREVPAVQPKEQMAVQLRLQFRQRVVDYPSLAIAFDEDRELVLTREPDDSSDRHRDERGPLPSENPQRARLLSRALESRR